MKWLFLIGLFVASTQLNAEINNELRAKSNYQIFCQGCHSPEGLGNKGVPQMKDEVGHFLQFHEGREYLVRVPGSANSSLNDQQLSEVLNWIVVKFGGSSIPPQWQAFTAEEVGKLRQFPLLEVFEYRQALLKKHPR